MGDLNLLGWVVLKSDESMTNDLNEPLVNFCAIKHNDYWERLVNTDIDTIFFILQFSMVII